MPEALCEALAFQTVQRLRRFTGRLAGVAGRAKPSEVGGIEKADALPLALAAGHNVVGFAMHPEKAGAVFAAERGPKGDQLAHPVPIATGEDPR